MRAGYREMAQRYPDKARVPLVNHLCACVFVCVWMGVCVCVCACRSEERRGGKECRSRGAMCE